MKFKIVSALFGLYIITDLSLENTVYATVAETLISMAVCVVFIITIASLHEYSN